MTTLDFSAELAMPLRAPRARPATFSDPSTAAAVCDALCGSIPIITDATNSLPQLVVEYERPVGMSDFR